MIRERRKYIRFLPENNAFAAIGAEYSRVGKIIDISIRGLAFGYLKQFENDNPSSMKVIIFESDDKFHLEDIPCMIVCDIPMSPSKDRVYSASPAISHRCGIQFTDITEPQSKMLEQFLKHYTRGYAPSHLKCHI